MSLQEKLKIGLYGSKGKPRLFYARIYFQQFGLEMESNFKELQDFYLEWRIFDEYLVLQKQTESLRVKGEVVRKTIAVKCSKRGNDVYWWRVNKRLRFLNNLRSLTLFDPHGSIKSTNVLFVTLTQDIRRCSVRDACETVGVDFNNWIRNLRKKYGLISYLRCWEASKKGYLHIHVLKVFHDYEFKVTFSQLKGSRRVYRIGQKEEFEKSWHSFVDVQAVRKMRKGITYVTKYMSKSKYPSKTQTQTLALCWLFSKRSFAVSGDFQKLITPLNGKKRIFFQIDLLGSILKNEVNWIFIGVKSLVELKSEYSKLDFNDSWSLELPYCAWDSSPTSRGGDRFTF